MPLKIAEICQSPKFSRWRGQNFWGVWVPLNVASPKRTERDQIVSGVIYEGRKYVAEGFPFSITCLKSSYGVPKWTRNGLSIDQLDPEYVIVQESVPDDGIRMELRVKMAQWKHRGHYKCDPLSKKSHEIEIVPSR
ncbi:uncharacterized protein TNIN_449291, partial [Trichonephila inaurata madagascariensis]